MTKILSISVSDDDKAMLELMQLSPSGLMKQKLAEVRLNAENYQKKILEFENNIKRLMQTLQMYADFVELKGLTDEIMPFLNKNVLETKNGA